MQKTKTYPVKGYDFILAWFFRFTASGYLPAKWFRDDIISENKRTKVEGKFHLEIVSHCWNYSNMLAYQLSSFVNYPPKDLIVTVTIFYNPEDKETQELLDFFSQKEITNVIWNWQILPKEQLFRRGIGRNMSARSTTADWIWYSDCDIIFHENCLDSLAQQLQGKQASLYFPRQERTTAMLAESDPMLTKGRKPQIVDITSDEFTLHSRDRAKGAFQIVHGDVARSIGYCEGLSIYQTPSEHWCKCYEDRAFRWLLGTQGTPIDVDGVYQIRHVHKGRYKKNTLWSKVRSKIRRLQE